MNDSKKFFLEHPDKDQFHNTPSFIDFAFTTNDEAYVSNILSKISWFQFHKYFIE